jgi:excisionase family DNA binding protein
VTEELLTVHEAARRLGLKNKTIRKWITLRKIEFIKAGERSVRISSLEIDRIIESGRIPRLNSSRDERPLDADLTPVPLARQARKAVVPNE